MPEWERVPLGEVVTPTQRTVEVNPGTAYRTIGVRWWGGGAYERQTIDGSQTAAKTLSIVHKDDLIINKIWVRHGSTAIAGADVHGCAASNEFPTFELDRTRVIPEWLHYLTQTREFWAECDALSQGTSGKNRIKPEKFLTIEIPLPPLPEQQRIVARVKGLLDKVEEARRLREEVESAVPNLLAAGRRQFFTPDSALIPLRTYVKSIENGWSPACETRPATRTEWGVLKVGATSFGDYRDTENKALPIGLEPRPELEVQVGDFLMSRANTPTLVGSCVVVTETKPKLMLSDKIFRFIFDKNQPPHPNYLWHALKSPFLREQIERAASGTSPTMQNISKESVLSLVLPIHSLDEQQAIADELDALSQRTKILETLKKQQALELQALPSAILAQAFAGAL
ncbi:restriction endonuclease subunit S [Deinococcus cavernae]|uniref:Restriction endonuclease subunit S n=1 Tax=Deinococcus cavernae TaxID=2320857 RepID=A0A418VHN6_9DEIO|nr:restriction endonuclease subunit S [Deinococcus cavernae]RJF75646.1 restriction endonuclease subunit S [Deinococcus cavernae]